ncbi:hypothetical protein TNCV_4746571 [Trichonephila clavipes]|nr:hypothetical protein TNCV_4746571 [Trichonephila clavipes]
MVTYTGMGTVGFGPHGLLRHLVFNILKDNQGRWKPHSGTLIGSFMARREPRVLPLEQSMKGEIVCDKVVRGKRIDCAANARRNEHDFSAAKTTDRDVVGDATEINRANPQTMVVENQHINPPEEPKLMENTDSDTPK